MGYTVYHDLDVECSHRTFTGTENVPSYDKPACDPCTIDHLKKLLDEANRDKKWTCESLGKNKSGWARRSARLQAERDAADMNAGRMQRELLTLRRKLVEEAEAFVRERMLPPEPSPGPNRRDWYVDHKEPTDKLLQWLKNWAYSTRHKDDPRDDHE